MKKVNKLIIIPLYIVLILLVIIISAFGFRSKVVSLEERIDAQYISNQSNYDNMWKSFKELTQVTDIQVEQYKDIYTGLIEARYNDGDLLFKMIHEQNPEINGEVYIKLAEEISAGRKTFDNNQKQLADIVREYNSYIRKHFICNSIFRFEEKDIQDFIVTSEQTNNAFENNKDDFISLK